MESLRLGRATEDLVASPTTVPPRGVPSSASAPRSTGGRADFLRGLMSSAALSSLSSSARLSSF
eukprot:7239020-Alexandrium_andersonii.AAC.1